MMDLHMKEFDGTTFGMSVQASDPAFRRMKKNAFTEKVTPRGWHHERTARCVHAADVAAVMGPCGWLVSEGRYMETIRWGSDGTEHYIIYEKEREMINQKFEITDIAHEKYPFLRRIRALRDIGGDVKKGDLGGFVEHKGNLSSEPEDDAWIYNDAIVAGDGLVDKNTVLRERAVVCGHAYASHGSVLTGDARAEDDAYIRGATLLGSARVSGQSMILSAPDDPERAPRLLGHCCVYGKVSGSVFILGSAVIASGEEICNTSPDTIMINGTSRTVLRESYRDGLKPRQPAEKEKKPKRRETAR